MDDSYLDVYNLHGFKAEHENMEPDKLLSEARSIKSQYDEGLIGQDLAKVRCLLGLAAQKGSIEGNYRYAFMFDGFYSEIPVDKNAYITHLRRASEAEPASENERWHVGAACYYLALCYFDGWGVERNPDEGCRLLERGVEMGSVWACYKYGMILTSQSPYPVEPDMERGYELLMKAATMEDENGSRGLAMLGLGAHYQSGNYAKPGEDITSTYILAENWFRQAADAGNVDAMIEYGCCLINRQANESECQQGVELLRKAVANGGDDQGLLEDARFLRGANARYQALLEAPIDLETTEDTVDWQEYVRVAAIYLFGVGVPRSDTKASIVMGRLLAHGAMFGLSDNFTSKVMYKLARLDLAPVRHTDIDEDLWFEAYNGQGDRISKAVMQYTSNMDGAEQYDPMSFWLDVAFRRGGTLDPSLFRIFMGASKILLLAEKGIGADEPAIVRANELTSWIKRIKNDNIGDLQHTLKSEDLDGLDDTLAACAFTKGYCYFRLSAQLSREDSSLSAEYKRRSVRFLEESWSMRPDPVTAAMLVLVCENESASRQWARRALGSDANASLKQIEQGDSDNLDLAQMTLLLEYDETMRNPGDGAIERGYEMAKLGVEHGYEPFMNEVKRFKKGLLGGLKYR